MGPRSKSNTARPKRSQSRRNSSLIAADIDVCMSAMRRIADALPPLDGNVELLRALWLQTGELLRAIEHRAEDGVVPEMAPPKLDTGLMDFVAWMVYQQEFGWATLWLTTRIELRHAALIMARSKYIEWVIEERAMELQRKSRGSALGEQLDEAGATVYKRAVARSVQPEAHKLRDPKQTARFKRRQRHLSDMEGNR